MAVRTEGPKQDMEKYGKELSTFTQVYQIYKAISFTDGSAYFHIVAINLMRVFTKYRHHAVYRFVKIKTGAVSGKLKCGMYCRLSSYVRFNPGCKWIKPADSWLVRVDAAITSCIQEPAAKRSPILLWLLVIFSFEGEHCECCNNISKGFLLLPTRDRCLISDKFCFRGITGLLCYSADVVLRQGQPTLPLAAVVAVWPEAFPEHIQPIILQGWYMESYATDIN